MRSTSPGDYTGASEVLGDVDVFDVFVFFFFLFSFFFHLSSRRGFGFVAIGQFCSCRSLFFFFLF